MLRIFFKWPNVIFKIPDMLQWLVVVTESRVIEEIRKAPEDVLSFKASLDEVSTNFAPVVRSMKTCLVTSSRIHSWGAYQQ
jgi:hypothetical protein